MTPTELLKILESHKSWAQTGYGKRANLQNANLRYANLQNADLRHADLRYADLRHANLRYADLRHADLQNANLRYADLRHADLRCADMRYANPRYAALRYANLQGANLHGANLRYADGNGLQVKSITFTKYVIAYSAWDMAIGCQQHTLDAWFAFSDAEIAEMDGGALEWWQVYGPLLKQIIETSPAEV